MARLALGFVMVVFLLDPAHAEVVVRAGVPFTTHELRAALRLRGAALTDVDVHTITPTVVELRTSVGHQRVDLGAARGPAAARLVALQLAVIGDAEPRSPALSVEDPAATGWTLGLAAGAGHGTRANDFALLAMRAELVCCRGAWRWGASVGWLHGLARTPDSAAPATADLGVLRVVAGVAIDRFELLVGPALVPYRVTAASSGVTASAGGSLRVRLITGDGWRAIASADVDGFLHRVIVARDNAAFAATPRIAITAALGIAWGP